MEKAERQEERGSTNSGGEVAVQREMQKLYSEIEICESVILPVATRFTCA